MAWYHWYGASIKPYAPFSSLQTSLVASWRASISSLTGSIANVRSACGFPWRNAASMSKERNCHPLEAINCNNNIFEFLPSAGESRGKSSSLGSRYPRITNLALALVAFLCWLLSSGLVSTGFHVRIHRHLRIWLGGTWFRKILDTVPVLIQLWTSVILAFWNSIFSEAESSESLTSDLCRLEADAKKAISEGVVSLFQASMSFQRQGSRISMLEVLQHQRDLCQRLGTAECRTWGHHHHPRQVLVW